MKLAGTTSEKGIRMWRAMNRFSANPISKELNVNTENLRKRY
jgi:hypothetical protein